MKVEYSDASYASLYPFAGVPIIKDETQLSKADYTPSLIHWEASCGCVAGKLYRNRQRILNGHATARATVRQRLTPKSMGHPEGHSDQFPAPPKAWECCGCKQKFYNFEKECNFCATLFCKDCKKIPWK